MLAKPNR